MSSFSAELDREMEFALKYFAGFDLDADIRAREEVLAQKKGELVSIATLKQDAAERAVSDMYAQLERVDAFAEPRVVLVVDLPQQIRDLKLTKDGLLKALETGKKERQVQAAQKAQLIQQLAKLRRELQQISHVGFSDRKGPRSLTPWSQR